MADLRKIIKEVAAEEGIDKELIDAIIKIEKQYDEDTQAVKSSRQKMISNEVDEKLGL